jgi:hypothetical protein
MSQLHRITVTPEQCGVTDPQAGIAPCEHEGANPIPVASVLFTRSRNPLHSVLRERSRRRLRRPGYRWG